MPRPLTVLLLATFVIGCNKETPESERIPLSQMQAPGAEADAGLSGTVLEQLPAGQYLYLRLKTAEGEKWAAVGAATVETGSEVTVMNPILMKDFESSALNRKFPEVYFGEVLQGGAGAGVPNPHAGGAPPAAPQVAVGKVEKATGPDARTVAETWEQKDRLEGKSVTIRGVVVKINEGVMGKNWIHLQDGSGEAAKGTNDITITTLDMARQGETITIKGTVHTNRDIGAGYSYPVLVEDAKIVKN